MKNLKIKMENKMNPINNKICLVLDFSQFKAGEGYAFNDQVDRKVSQKLNLTNNGKYEKFNCNVEGNAEIYFTNIHDIEEAKVHVLETLIELDALDKLVRLEKHTIEFVSMERLFHSIAV